MSGAGKSAPSTLLDYVLRTAEFFAGKGIDSARLDAELLLAEVLGMTRVQLYTSFERPLATAEVDRYRELVRRRALREPVAYITGRREFWSLDFAVDRRVLVPRPETELLVEIAVEVLRTRGNAPANAPGAASADATPATPLRVADIGTGSGAIAVAIARELAAATIVAVDKSEAALELAPRNAERHGVAARIEFRAGDGCAPLGGCEPYDAIVSNPPYVKSAELRTLEPEVREWEPRSALDGGADGMDVTAPLIDAAFALLAPGGALLIEVGTQAEAVRDAMIARGFEDVALRRDLAGIARVAIGRRPGDTARRPTETAEPAPGETN